MEQVNKRALNCKRQVDDPYWQMRNKEGALKRSNPVRNVTTGAVYTSAKDAANTLGVSAANIHGACAGKLKTAYGCKWEFVDKGHKPKGNTRPVINVTTGAIYKTIMDAAREYNTSHIRILDSCNGRTIRSFGCKWRLLTPFEIRTYL